MCGCLFTSYAADDVVCVVVCVCCFINKIMCLWVSVSVCCFFLNDVLPSVSSSL